MEKELRLIDYGHLVKALNLYPEPSFHCVDFSMERSEPGIIDGSMDRSIMLRDTFMLIICRKGGIVVNVGGVSHTVSAGQMVLILAGTWCRFSQPTPNYECVTLLGRLSRVNLINSIVTSFPRVRQAPVVSLLHQENLTITAIMNYVKATSVNHRSPSRSEIDNAVLTAVRCELMDIFLRRHYTVRDASADEQLVKKFHSMLSVHSIEHRDVEFYANELGLKPKTFAAKVRKVAGTTPLDLISQAVVTHAKRLLSSTTLTSAEIAEKLNFPTPSFFCRYFKRYAGVTPQEWRNAHIDF